MRQESIKTVKIMPGCFGESYASSPGNSIAIAPNVKAGNRLLQAVVDQEHTCSEDTSRNQNGKA